MSGRLPPPDGLVSSFVVVVAMLVVLASVGGLVAAAFDPTDPTADNTAQAGQPIEKGEWIEDSVAIGEVKRYTFEAAANRMIRVVHGLSYSGRT